MRQVTATEKFRAVNEGKMAKGEFVRQMRMAHPSVISQWNSYNDTVTILKNRGYITEKTGVDTYDSRADLNISSESIDRGVRYELAAQGHDPATCTDKELVAKVTDRVVKNLKKDPLHYINLLAKESSKTDKHDREEEVKRGEAKKDVFNGEKKADLREGKPGEHPDGTPKSNDEMDDDEKNDFYDNLDSMEEIDVAGHEIRKSDEKQNIIDVAREIRAKYGEIPGFTGVLKDFLQTHMDDVKSGAVSDPIAEFDNFVDANYDKLTEKYDREEEDGHVGTNTDDDFEREQLAQLAQREGKGKDHDGDGDIDSDDYLAAKDKAIKKAMGKDVNEMSAETIDVLTGIIGAGGLVGGSVAIKKLLDALESGKLGDKGKAVAQYLAKAGSAAASSTQKHEEVNEMSPEVADVVAFLATGAGITGASHVAGKLLSALENGRFGEKGKEIAQDIHNLAKTDVEEGQINERGNHIMQQINGIIQDMAADFGGEDVEAAEELIEAIAQEYGIDFEFGAGESRQQEALRESVKNIITKVLEEQVINEAATNELARIADEYEEFDGLKQTVVALQNIVTEIESFYDKTRDKIQKVYDSIGEVRNEEGLKVGAFLAPSIESAFNKDLRPVTKAGFTKGLDTPKVKTISSAEVDAARAAGDIEEDPKQTMFTPVNENKK